VSSFCDQFQYAVRFEWGARGLDAVGPGSDLIIVVDVLSFSTCVDIATARGATILPYRWRDDSAADYATTHGALLATKERRASGGFSLSPASLAAIPDGTRLVLPSPNGATLSLQAAAYSTTVAGCLRNSAAVAEFAKQSGTISVIACGEQWPDSSLRPAWEDFVGAGSIIAHLPGPRSPEAQAACDAFRRAERELPRLLKECSSGRELVEKGFAADVELAAACGVSNCVPLLEKGAFVRQVAGHRGLSAGAGACHHAG
jgi:2-phosphosulfolactate phosphatase